MAVRLVLSKREHAHILAGLRLLQHYLQGPHAQVALACYVVSEGHETLKDAEIDSLIERINEGDNPRYEAYRKAAKEMYQDEGTLEVDNDAVVSEGDEDGAYVEAWVWVRKDEAGICRECGEPNADNGEGWDGLCGNCADKAEAEKGEK